MTHTQETSWVVAIAGVEWAYRNERDARSRIADLASGVPWTLTRRTKTVIVRDEPIDSGGAA